MLGVHIIRNKIIGDVFRGPLLRATKIWGFQFYGLTRARASLREVCRLLNTIRVKVT